MIQEYIDKIAERHHLEESRWMEEQVRAALGPFKWWLIEATNWKWLARWFDVTINVRQVPDGNLVTIRKGGIEIAQREFSYNVKEES